MSRRNMLKGLGGMGLVGLVPGAGIPWSSGAAPCPEGAEVTIEGDTQYPFEDEVRLTVRPDGSVAFPLKLRIPSWVEGRASIRVNGQPYTSAEGGKLETVERRWSKGDQVEIMLPAKVESNRAHERAISLQREPLVFARAVKGEREQVGSDH